MHVEDDGYIGVEKCGLGATGADVVYLRCLHSVHPSNNQFKCICIWYVNARIKHNNRIIIVLKAHIPVPHLFVQLQDICLWEAIYSWSPADWDQRVAVTWIIILCGLIDRAYVEGNACGKGHGHSIGCSAAW